MVMLIAEVGVNHNGCPDLLVKLVGAAAEAGADACKFQTFKADRLAKRDTPKVQYQMATSDPAETHWEMLKSLELTDEMHRLAIESCESYGVEFISTPYDPESVEYLNDLGVKTVKTASADVVDHRIHRKIVELGLNPIIAVGMASMAEIREMLEIYDGSRLSPTLLHCVSNYPCSHESLNLSCIPLLREEFKCKVGFSDHSVDAVAAGISVALGATVIEKHFTLDKTMSGPDHKASSTPVEFKDLVSTVRQTETVLGSPIKKIQQEEAQMCEVSRKSVCASNDIASGTVLSEENLTMLRPGKGLQGGAYYELIGKRLKIDLRGGQALTWGDVE